MSSCVAIDRNLSQAYDGHMNLIMSDVEETIMVVEGLDEPASAPPSIQVSA